MDKGDFYQSQQACKVEPTKGKEILSQAKPGNEGEAGQGSWGRELARQPVTHWNRMSLFLPFPSGLSLRTRGGVTRR